MASLKPYPGVSKQPGQDEVLWPQDGVGPGPRGQDPGYLNVEDPVGPGKHGGPGELWPIDPVGPTRHQASGDFAAQTAQMPPQEPIQAGVPPGAQPTTNVAGESPAGPQGYPQNDSQGHAFAGGAQSFEDILKSMLDSGGGFNQKLVDQRVGAARGTMEGQKRASLDDMMARMSGMGQLGSGAEASALGRLSTDLGTGLDQNIQDIYGDESKNATDRTVAAIQGLNTAQGNDIQLSLGQQQLALSTLHENNAWNEFLANYGLDSAKVANDIQQGNSGLLIQLLKLWQDANGNSNQGYI